MGIVSPLRGWKGFCAALYPGVALRSTARLLVGDRYAVAKRRAGISAERDEYDAAEGSRSVAATFTPLFAKALPTCRPRRGVRCGSGTA
jgi:hypothetical protein